MAALATSGVSYDHLTLDFDGGDNYDEYDTAEDEEDDDESQPEIVVDCYSEEKESEEYEDFYCKVADSRYDCVHDDEEEKEETNSFRSHSLISSSTMASAVAAAALDRTKRLEVGGPKKVTIIHDEHEYRRQFISVAAAAAEMGRLTQLPEEVVMAIVPTKDNRDHWNGPSGILALTSSPTYLAVIHEAAKAGNARKLPEHVAANYDEEDDPCSKPSPRLQELLELNQRTGTGQQKVDTFIQTMKEKEQEWVPKVQKHDLEVLELPKRKPPKFVKKSVETAPGPTPCIHMLAAEKAWARRQRLDRPGAELKVSPGCPCPYCSDPNPFQTFAYREKQLLYRQRGYESDSSEDTPEPPPTPTPVVSTAKKYVPKSSQFKKSDNLPVWPPPDPNQVSKKAEEPEMKPEPLTADTGCSCVIL